MKTKIITHFILFTAFLLAINSCNNRAKDSGKDIFSHLSTTEKSNLNVFFSNFSKIYTDTFSQGKIIDKIKINFAVYYNYRNNFKALEIVNEGNSAALNADIASKTAEEFFGKAINKNQPIENIAFENNKYVIRMGDGERFLFAQILSLSDMGNDIFDAKIQIYAAGSGWAGDPNAAPEMWKNQGEEIDKLPVQEVKMKAKLKKISNNGITKYNLLEFLFL